MIAIVIRKNPFFPPGTWVEGFDDGWQQCQVETINNRLRVISHSGILYPKGMIEEFLMRPKKRGLDK